MSTTVLPLPLASTPSHYPLVSIFKKILPSSIPERFSSFFKEVEEEQKPPSKEIIDPRAPIAAKEIFELNTEATESPTTVTTGLFETTV